MRRKKGYYFYERTWFILLMLFIFTPIGIFLLWKTRKFKPTIRILMTLCACLLYFSFIGAPDGLLNFLLPNTQPVVSDLNALKVHFIDVGQADAILVQMPDKQNMLIDAGNNDDGASIVRYLELQGVKKLSFVIGTHPHEDHIGGLDMVIDHFDVGRVYMPKVTANTKTFNDVLAAVQKKGLKILSAKAGIYIIDSENLDVEILAPNYDHYDEINNYSAVVKLTFGYTSFLFTGDAEEISENEMLSKGFPLQSDVLKVGHHGSTSSTTKTFLDAVSPKYAVIMCGVNNKYGHPHHDTLERLNKKGVEIFRTDKHGTIVASSDGQTITFERKSTVMDSSFFKAMISNLFEELKKILEVTK